MNKKYIWAIIAVVILFFIGFSFNKNNDGGKVIKIGAPLSLTGTAATDGMSIKKGLDLAQEDLAKQGIRVDISYEDDGTDPKRTVSAVRKLITIDKPDAIVGPTWSFLLDSASSIFDQNKIVSFSPANTSEFTVGSNYVFYGATKNAEKEKTIETWLEANNKKRVAIIVDKSGWGESNLVPMEKAVKAVGAEIVLEERIPFGAEAESMPTILARVISAKADVILTTGYEEGLTILLNKVQSQKVNIPVIIASDLPKTLIKNKNVTLTPADQFYIITVQPSPAFAEKFIKKYGEAPGNYADRAYDGLMLLAEAIESKGTDESLANYLRNKTNYKGYAGTYDFDEKGDIVGGKWVIERLK